MKNWTLLICIILFISGSIDAQYLTGNWDETYDLGGNARLHALIQSMNGWLVGVGEIEVGRNQTDGLFLIIEPEYGKILYQKKIGGSGDEVFHDIVQLPDGGFYLAGSTSSNTKGKRDAWLLRVDEYGTKLEEMLSASRDDEVFYFVNLFTDGSLLLTGQKGRRPNGNIWLVSATDMQVRNEAFIGQGQYEEVVGTATTRSSTVWLYGNTTGKHGSEAGKGWMAEVDLIGNLIKGSQRTLERYDFEILNQKGLSPWNNILLTGNSLKGRQQDAWLVEVDEDGNELWNMTYGSEKEEFGRGAVKTVFEKYIIAREVHSPLIGQGFKNKLVLMDSGGNESEYQIPSEKPFVIQHLLPTFHRRFIVAGESYRGNDYSIRIHSIEEDNRLTSMKSDISVSCSQPRLIDNNRDGVLEAGERGAIVFEITNNGRADLLDGRVEIKGRKKPSDFQEVFFSFLPRGGKRRIRIPVKGERVAPDEIYQLKIVIYQKSKPIIDFPFRVNSKANTPGTTPGLELDIIADWETAYSNSGKHNNVDVRVSEGNIRIDYEATAPYQMKDTDFRLRNNGRSFRDQKDGNKIFNTIPTNSIPYKFKHTLTYEVPLDTGQNQIIIEAFHDGQLERADTLSFVFLPRQPNLHVVVLAPETDLNYNVEDALNFAGLMENQAGRGYFREVFIDTLVAKQATSTMNTKVAFAKLRKRYNSNDGSIRNIADNDVLVIFISSHGLIAQDGRFKIMPSDYTNDPDLELIYTIDYERDILEPLNDIKCKKLVLIDACHSGAAGAKSKISNLSSIINELNARAPGMLTISSSKSGERSYENEKWKNGAFTEAIIEAFRGLPVLLDEGLEVSPEITMTEDGLRLISIQSIFRFLQQRVPNLVSALGANVGQTPTIPYRNESLMNIKFLIVE